jgi:serine protease Do
MGSGIIYSADGYIVTNEHVVDNADDIKVNLSDGRTFEAKIKGVDKKSDLAVLKIDAKGLPAARLGDSDKLQVGEIVIAIGSPFGLNETVTTGIVSAKGRYGMGIEDYENFIQTDAAINPGNSGGPLLNLDGEVIGINTAIFSRSGAYQGVGFAIPVNMVKNVAGQLIDKGEVTRGWLGVSIQNVTPELAKQFDIAEDAKGVVVSDVYDATPAAQAGLKPGDVVVAYNGQKIENVNELRQHVADTAPGTTAKLKVLRGGKEMDLAVKIAKQTPEALAMAANPEDVRSNLGMSVQDITPEIATGLGIKGALGVVVTDLTPGGPAETAGIKQDDIITQVKKEPVKNVQEFNKALASAKPGDKVLMLVHTKNMCRFVVVNVPKD